MDGTRCILPIGTCTCCHCSTATAALVEPGAEVEEDVDVDVAGRLAEKSLVGGLGALEELEEELDLVSLGLGLEPSSDLHSTL